MIFYKDKKIRKQIEADYKELENYKNSYSKRMYLYNTYLGTMKVFEDEITESTSINKEDMENKKQIYQKQIEKIDSNLELLTSLLKNIDATGNIGVEKNILNKYNQKYKEIRNNYIINSIFEEQITEKYINELMNNLAKTLEKVKDEYVKEMEKVLTEKNNIHDATEKNEKIIQKEKIANDIDKKEAKENHIKNNNTLLISEKQGKVILPYKAEEVFKIYNNSKCKYWSVEDVIKDKFTRNFSDFKIQFASRYAETMKLAREREKYNLLDSVALATEMMKKRLLHPAIISACRTLNELDVYLDCLDKNELEDFKIFNIKYELYPMVVKSHGVKSYNDKKIAKHYEKSNSKIFNIIKSIFQKNNKEIDKIYDE